MDRYLVLLDSTPRKLEAARNVSLGKSLCKNVALDNESPAFQRPKHHGRRQASRFMVGPRGWAAWETRQPLTGAVGGVVSNLVGFTRECRDWMPEITGCAWKMELSFCSLEGMPLLHPCRGLNKLHIVGQGLGLMQIRGDGRLVVRAVPTPTQLRRTVHQHMERAIPDVLFVLEATLSTRVQTNTDYGRLIFSFPKILLHVLLFHPASGTACSCPNPALLAHLHPTASISSAGKHHPVITLQRFPSPTIPRAHRQCPRRTIRWLPMERQHSSFQMQTLISVQPSTSSHGRSWAFLVWFWDFDSGANG